jgi:hypothetical protein
MTRDPGAVDSSLASALRTFRRPWPLMGAALACTVVGLALSQTSLIPLRLLLLGAGLLLAGGAVARRLQTASWELEDRVESAGVLFVSAFEALLSYLALDKSWDSGEVFLEALIGIALIGSFIVLLPRTGRRIAAVLFVLFHFCGILTAVTSVPPRNDAPPWLATLIWSKFYRHYLFFTHFTNAYHFYSPDPGPPTLLWFHIEYANGSARWKKIPNRDESPIGLHHQRMLAAAESTMNPAGPPILSQEIVQAFEQKTKLKYELFPGIPHASGEEIMQRRKKGGDMYKFVDPDDKDKEGRPRSAPLWLIFEEQPPLMNQYSEPNDFSRRLIASYARHIAHSYADPDNAVKAVRVYRLIHKMITPRELYEGKDPLEPTNFLSFYMGKYDPDGKILDPEDPFLFWHVPIVRVSKRYPEPGTFIPPFSEGNPTPISMLSMHGLPWQPSAEDPGKILDFVQIHAEQAGRFYNETSKK